MDSIAPLPGIGRPKFNLRARRIEFPAHSSAGPCQLRRHFAVRLHGGGNDEEHDLEAASRAETRPWYAPQAAFIAGRVRLHDNVDAANHGDAADHAAQRPQRWWPRAARCPTASVAACKRPAPTARARASGGSLSGTSAMIKVALRWQHQAQQQDFERPRRQGRRRPRKHDRD